MDTHSLALLAGVLSKKYGVSVTSNGSSAYSTVGKDGRFMVNIPALELDDPDYVTLCRGYIDHEAAGHGAHTDWGVWNQICSIGPYWKSVGNVYEDSRVERLAGACYPGCRRNLRNLNELLFSTRYDPVKTDDKGTRIINYLLSATVDMSADSQERVRGLRKDELEQVCPGLADALEPLIARAAGTESTQDVHQLVLDTKELLKHWLDDEPKEEPQQSKGEAVGQMLQEALDVAGERQNELSVVPSDAQANASAFDDSRRDDCFDYMPSKLRDAGMLAASALNSRLAGLLQHKRLDRTGGARQGRLDMRKLYRLATNDPRIFQRKVEKKALNTEVVILVDASGSMSGSKASITSASVYALVHALRLLKGVRSAAYGFYGGTFVKLAGFNDSLTNAKFYMRHPQGSTPGGKALHLALQRFTPSGDVRRICVVLTDGMVDDLDLWEANRTLAENNNIDLLGVGIDSEHINMLCREDSRKVVRHLNELPNAMFSMLERRLLWI